MRMDPLIGTVDGQNRRFQTLFDHVPGTVRAFNPIAQLKSFVTDIDLRNVDLQIAPQTGDTWFLFYTPL